MPERSRMPGILRIAGISMQSGGPKMDRRTFSILGATALAGTRFGALTTKAHAADNTIRLALQPAPLLGFYVKEKKLLEKRGFKPEWNVFPFSPPILEAMAAGSVDIALLGVLPVISSATKDAGVWYFYDELANAAGLMVQADSAIKGPADLKGKKIAFPGKASQLYGQLLIYLSGSGVTENDIDLVRANATDMGTLFQRKAVDGMLAWPPFTTEPVRSGAGRTLFTADDLLKLKAGHWLNSGWGVRADYAKSHEDAVLAVVESLHEATRVLREKPEEVYGVFAQATGYDVDAIRFLVKENYEFYYDPKDTTPSAANLQQLYDVMAKYDIVKSEKPIKPVLEALVHPEFVEKVLAKAK
ncbi:MAG: ABC transporter substrate-binding protein [Hyphomicrobiales bacterium]